VPLEILETEHPAKGYQWEEIDAAMET
jgi:hypothetical protein